ncbi:hypothetical protein BG006_011282 [Podila minutissima]|uniref:Uncharacterized protein n=1 Tax=Podila minutissima TaxID=64525 RepID=A0A9P5VI24_9FUNG|nr:hypothetical protein BG006_011282 [Podila minutissima]
MTVPGQDQDSSDVEVVVSTRNQSQEYNVITAPESTPSKHSKQVSPSVATNSGTAPSISSQETTSNSSDIAVALQENDNNTQSAHTAPQPWSSLDIENAQDESLDSPVRFKLSRRTAIATTPTPTSKKLNPFLVQDSEPKSRSYSVAPLIGRGDAVDEGEDEGEDEDEQEGRALYDERERHSDYSSGTSTPTLAITPTLTARIGARTFPSTAPSSPSTAPSSPSTRPMTRSTSKNQFLESLDQDDEHEIRLMNQRRQPQTTPTRQIGFGQPQPVKRNHTVDLWGRAYYEPTRNSSLTRTPSKKRNAQGNPVRFMSPPGRAFDPLSYDPLTQYKLRIPRLSDQEDNGGTQEDDDSEQDGPSALATQEEDCFRTPKRKRRSKLPLMKLERPFAARSCQSSDQEQDGQDPAEVLNFDAVFPDDGIDPEEELYDGNVRDKEGPYDEGSEVEEPAEGEESEIDSDQEAKVQSDDDSEEITQVSRARESVHDDESEEEDEGGNGGPSVQSTPSKYSQRDRLLLDLNSRGPSHFIGDDFQTPPRKNAARDHFNNLQPPPAPRVPDWAMFSQLSDRQSRYGTPGWIPTSVSQAGDSPSRSRSLRTSTFGSKLGLSKNARN